MFMDWGAGFTSCAHAEGWCKYDFDEREKASEETFKFKRMTPLSNKSTYIHTI